MICVFSTPLAEFPTWGRIEDRFVGSRTRVRCRSDTIRWCGGCRQEVRGGHSYPIASLLVRAPTIRDVLRLLREVCVPVGVLSDVLCVFSIPPFSSYSSSRLSVCFQGEVGRGSLCRGLFRWHSSGPDIPTTSLRGSMPTVQNAGQVVHACVSDVLYARRKYHGSLYLCTSRFRVRESGELLDGKG